MRAAPNGNRLHNPHSAASTIPASSTILLRIRKVINLECRTPLIPILIHKDRRSKVHVHEVLPLAAIREFNLGHHQRHRAVQGWVYELLGDLIAVLAGAGYRGAAVALRVARVARNVGAEQVEVVARLRNGDAAWRSAAVVGDGDVGAGGGVDAAVVGVLGGCQRVCFGGRRWVRSWEARLRAG